MNKKHHLYKLMLDLMKPKNLKEFLLHLKKISYLKTESEERIPRWVSLLGCHETCSIRMRLFPLK